MNKTLAGIGILCLLFACTNSEEYVLEGQLKQAVGIKVITLYEGDNPVDSAFLDESGKFRFTGSAPEPSFYTLAAGEMSYFLILENGDDVTLQANLADDTGVYEVSGSPASAKIQEFSAINNHHLAISRKIQDEFRERLAANPDSQDQLREEYLPKFRQNVNSFSEAALNFAKKNQDNLAGFYAISTLDPAQYEGELIAYSELIKDKFTGNTAVLDFLNRIHSLKSTSIGQLAPDFESTTPDGKAIKLSDFRGKYLLVDFWASWCGPCREENPNLVKQYYQYNNKGFTVLGVSLDRSRPEWLKGIADDGLVWTQVSDLMYWNSKVVQLYQISAIPASLIIDPKGIIVAKNLRGEELGAFLQKTLD